MRWAWPNMQIVFVSPYYTYSDRSGLVWAYLAVGEKPPSVHLTTTAVIHTLGHGLQHISSSA